MPFFHWGNEVVAGGQSIFYATAGDGRNIKIISIDGAVTSSPQQGCIYILAPDKPRQALIALTCNRPDDPVKTSVEPKTQAINNFSNEVDGALLMVNTKLIGLDNMVVPVHITFDIPVVASKGQLTLTVTNVGTMPLYIDKNTSDVETHLTIQWDYAS